MRVRFLISAVILALLGSSVSFSAPVCCSSQIQQLVFDTQVRIPTSCQDTIAEVGMYGNYPIYVEIIGGVICHIGLNVFGIQGDEVLPKHIARFIERYALRLLTVPNGEWADLMAGDRVSVTGDFALLPVNGIEGYDLGLQLADNREYRVTFAKEGLEPLQFVFPAECELLWGMDKKELESYFCFGINTHKYSGKTIAGDPSDTIRLTDDISFDKMGTYIIEDMLQGLYYSRSDNGRTLIDSVECYPIYSIQNLLSEPSLSEGIMAEVSVRKYGFSSEVHTVPLANVLDMCLDDGCLPYVGFSEIRKENNVVAVLIMANQYEGYNHIFEFTFNKEFLNGSSRHVTADVNAFVPTDNIASLYDENNQKRHVDDVRKMIIK